MQREDVYLPEWKDKAEHAVRTALAGRFVDAVAPLTLEAQDKAFQRFSKFDPRYDPTKTPEDNFGGWLWRIATNEANDFLRKEGRWLEAEAVLLATVDNEPEEHGGRPVSVKVQGAVKSDYGGEDGTLKHLGRDTTELDRIESVSNAGVHQRPKRPHEEASYFELVDQLTSRAQSMTRQDSQIVTMIVRDPGTKPRDIAAALNISPEAADSAYRRVLRDLRPWLKGLGYRLFAYAWEQALRRHDGICPRQT